MRSCASWKNRTTCARSSSNICARAIREGLNSGEPTPCGTLRRSNEKVAREELQKPKPTRRPGCPPSSSGRAQIALAEIWGYIADDGEARANTFIETIDQKFKA